MSQSWPESEKNEEQLQQDGFVDWEADAVIEDWVPEEGEDNQRRGLKKMGLQVAQILRDLLSEVKY